jgi:hypothetical protein
MRRTNGKKFVYVAGRYEYALGNSLLERLRVLRVETPLHFSLDTGFYLSL